MINPRTPSEFGPGLTRQTYLDQLADTGHTGWHDEHGVPAPWPEDSATPTADGNPRQEVTPPTPTPTNPSNPHQIEGSAVTPLPGT
jgi:hypothetical protein